MPRRIADGYGVQTYGNLQVGFKYIGGTIDEKGPERFVFGTEESHGYLAGTYARDKDAAVAAMLLAELAAQTKAAGQSAARKARRAVLAIRLPRRIADLGRHAGLARDGADGRADGRFRTIRPASWPA